MYKYNEDYGESVWFNTYKKDNISYVDIDLNKCVEEDLKWLITEKLKRIVYIYKRKQNVRN